MLFKVWSLMSLLNSAKLLELGTPFRYMQKLFHVSSMPFQYSFILLYHYLSGCVLVFSHNFSSTSLILSSVLSNLLFNWSTQLLISLTMFIICKVYIWFFFMSTYVSVDLLWFYNFLSFVMNVISSFLYPFEYIKCSLNFSDCSVYISPHFLLIVLICFRILVDLFLERVHPFSVACTIMSSGLVNSYPLWSAPSYLSSV